MTAKSLLPVAPRPVASVVKSEDKMETLKRFIGAALDGMQAVSPGAPPYTFTLVARSANSPVAQALAALSDRLIATRCTVNVILASFDAEAPAADWRIVSEAPGFLGHIRFARNPRLADAHEQLVISETACWVGDCMRRDPSKRDAFELYAPESAETAHTAAASFARLWGTCEPVTLRQTRPAARTTTVSALEPADAAAALAAAMAGETPHVVVSTLHCCDYLRGISEGRSQDRPFCVAGALIGEGADRRHGRSLDDNAASCYGCGPVGRTYAFI